jgi:diamine N-acetyltransferase
MAAASFRPATQTDVGPLLGFMRALYQEDGTTPLREDAAEAALRRLLAEPACGLVRVIERGGEAAGYLVLTWGFSLEFHGRDAFIDELYVAPRHRGAGLGRAAVEWAEAACREHGAGALHLEVEIANERAHGLYRSRGFAERGLRLMTKRLAAAPVDR